MSLGKSKKICPPIVGIVADGIVTEIKLSHRRKTCPPKEVMLSDKTNSSIPMQNSNADEPMVFMLARRHIVLSAMH